MMCKTQEAKEMVRNEGKHCQNNFSVWSVPLKGNSQALYRIRLEDTYSVTNENPEVLKNISSSREIRVYMYFEIFSKTSLRLRWTQLLQLLLVSITIS